MVELREARKIAANIGLGLQYLLKGARIFDIWSRLSPHHDVTKGEITSPPCLRGRQSA
jgi:hypothetical protein